MSLGTLAKSSAFCVFVLLWNQCCLAFNYLPSDVEITSNKNILAVGDRLEIRCRLKSNLQRSLEIHHGGTDLSEYVTKLDNVSIEVTIPNVTLDDNGTYHCYVSNHSHPVSISIHVAYAPTKPDKIHCYTMNLENMTCTWDLVKSAEDLNIVTNWTLFYTISTDFSWRENPSPPPDGHACPNELGKTGMGCHWYLHDPSSPSNNFRPGMIYWIWVKAENELGSRLSDVKVVDTKYIVKFTPAKALKAVAPRNSSVVKLTWEMTFRLFSRLPLVYNVTITCSTCLTNNRFQYGELTFKQRQNPWLETVTLVDLEPYVEYTVTVQIKTKGEGYWSNPASPIKIRTAEDVPLGEPVLVNSSFTIYDMPNNGRQLYLYWQPPDPKLRGGVITRYKLTVLDFETSTIQHEVISHNPMISNLILESNKKYQLDIAAGTVKGYGPSSGHMTLPLQGQVLSPVSMVTAESNNTHVVLHWQPPSGDIPLVGFTIHYCKGELTHEDIFVAKCEDDYQWMTVDPDQLSASVPLLKENQKYYVFGVSMETELSSSGITWSSCLSSMVGALSQIQMLSVSKVTETDVQLSWERVNCVGGQGRIVSYELGLCQGECDCQHGHIFNQSGSWEMDAMEIGELHPGTVYTVCIRAVGATRTGSWSSPMVFETNVPTPWALIVGCSVGSIALLAILAVLFWIWRFLMAPFTDEIPIPKPINDLFYVQTYEDVNSIGGENKGDNYTLCLEEQQPLMSDKPTEFKGKLQHLPVSNDSGNDSLSEDSIRNSLEGPTDRNSTSSEADRRFSDASNSPSQISMKRKTGLNHKRESGFFDDQKMDCIDKISLLTKSAKETNKPEEMIICHCHQSDSGGSGINGYSKFCEGSNCSGSCSTSDYSTVLLPVESGSNPTSDTKFVLQPVSDEDTKNIMIPAGKEKLIKTAEKVPLIQTFKVDNKSDRDTDFRKASSDSERSKDLKISKETIDAMLGKLGSVRDNGTVCTCGNTLCSNVAGITNCSSSNQVKTDDVEKEDDDCVFVGISDNINPVSDVPYVQISALDNVQNIEATVPGNGSNTISANTETVEGVAPMIPKVLSSADTSGYVTAEMIPSVGSE